MMKFEPIEKVSFMWFTKQGQAKKIGYRKVNAQAVDFFVKKLVHECHVSSREVVELLEKKLIPELKQYTLFEAKDSVLLKQVDFMRSDWKIELGNLMKIKQVKK